MYILPVSLITFDKRCNQKNGKALFHKLFSPPSAGILYFSVILNIPYFVYNVTFQILNNK